MRTPIFAGLAILAAAGLSACSEKTQDNLEQTGDSIGNDMSRAADDAGAAPPSNALPHQQRSPLGNISDGRQASPRLAGAEQWFRLSPGTITTIQRQKCQY